MTCFDKSDVNRCDPSIGLKKHVFPLLLRSSSDHYYHMNELRFNKMRSGGPGTLVVPVDSLLKYRNVSEHS